MRLLYVALMLVGCAHAPKDGGAALAMDHSHQSGDLYGSATDERSLPETPAARLARLYEDEDAETIVEGPVVAWDGEELDFVAMSRDLPAGTVVRITRLDDGRSIIVAVRRREPLAYGLIALSPVAAREMGLEQPTEARVEVLSRPELASR